MKPQLLGQTWHFCDRCGREWPDSYLQLNKNNKRICPDCWDIGETDPNAGDSQ